MKITPIKTDKITPKNHTIYDILDKFVVDVPENSILAVTSKIISICEGNVIKNDGRILKNNLVKDEADLYLPPTESKYNYCLTIKNNVLLPTAGIDESNGNGYFILWPKDPQKTINAIRKYLMERFKLKNVGAMITDSKTTPLRWGTTGVSVAHSGFKALNDYIGKPDIFGVKMQATKANIADAVAVSAVLCMGEGQEQTPMALIEDLPFVKFQKNNPTKKELAELGIGMEDDLYAPLLKSVCWKKKKE